MKKLKYFFGLRILMLIPKRRDFDVGYAKMLIFKGKVSSLFSSCPTLALFPILSFKLKFVAWGYIDLLNATPFYLEINECVRYIFIDFLVC